MTANARKTLLRSALVCVSLSPWLVGWFLHIHIQDRPVPPLVVAIHSKNSIEVTKLIAAGADVNAVGNYEASPLSTAAHLGDIQTIEQLIDAGAQLVNPKEFAGRPLIAAASHTSLASPPVSLQLVDYLLKIGANVNERSPRGESALYWGATFGRNDMVQLLISAGADVDASTCDGETPLMKAASSGHINIVKSLLAAGASPRTRTINGNSAFDYAKHKPEISEEIHVTLSQSNAAHTPSVYAGAACKFSQRSILMKQWGDRFSIPIGYHGWQQISNFGLGFIFLPC